MNAFQPSYNSLKLPSIPTLSNRQSAPAPVNISNPLGKSILDSLSGKLKRNVPTFTQNNNINDQLAPFEQLGSELIDQALLPEFQQQTLNPFLRNMSNQAAGSTLSLLGSAPRYLQQRTRDITLPFENQALSVFDLFREQGSNQLNQNIKNYYDSNLF
jgi:hypothetical protein